jgi:hypothetical protein
LSLTIYPDASFAADCFLSLMATTALALFVIIGYILTATIIGVVEIPLLILELEKMAASSSENVELKSTSRTTSLMYGSLGSGIFIGLHAINFEVNIPFYSAIVGVVVAPLLLSSIRANVEVGTSSSWQRWFAITYDLLTKRSFIRNYSMLFICCCLVRLFRLVLSLP